MIEDVPEKMLPARALYSASCHDKARQRNNYTAHHLLLIVEKRGNGLLNGCLNPQPCLVPNLFDVLLRFRCYEILLILDFLIGSTIQHHI